MRTAPTLAKIALDDATIEGVWQDDARTATVRLHRVGDERNAVIAFGDVATAKLLAGRLRRSAPTYDSGVGSRDLPRPGPPCATRSTVPRASASRASS